MDSRVCPSSPDQGCQGRLSNTQKGHVPARVAGQEGTHQRGQAPAAAAQQEMTVVAHKASGVAAAAGVLERIADVFKEVIFVDGVVKDVFSLDTANHDVVKGIGVV